MSTPNEIPTPNSPQMAGCQQEPCSACWSCGCRADPYFSRVEPMGYFCVECGEEWDTAVPLRRFTEALSVLERVCALTSTVLGPSGMIGRLDLLASYEDAAKLIDGAKSLPNVNVSAPARKEGL